jgi:hypothetical protein
VYSELWRLAITPPLPVAADITNLITTAIKPCNRQISLHLGFLAPSNVSGPQSTSSIQYMHPWQLLQKRSTIVPRWSTIPQNLKNKPQFGLDIHSSVTLIIREKHPGRLKNGP